MIGTLLEPGQCLKNKLNKDGEVTRNKTSLVCKGYAQVEGTDFEDTFSLVSRLDAIIIFLALAIFEQ